jgi:hypothetical protein
MTRITLGILGLVLVLPPIAWGQEKDPPEPPVRLKKKEKPKAPDEPDKKAEPARPPEPKEPPVTADPEQNPAEIVARVAKDMRASEERLGQKDASEGTRQIQRDILKNLDALIEQKKQQQQQQQQQQSASSSSSSRDQRRQQARNNRPQMKNQTTPDKSLSQKPQAKEMANKGGGTKDTPENMSKIADLYKDVWGHLPETLRQEMDQYAREKFMAKYGDLLKQYYATIAEKGHRKGE